MAAILFEIGRYAAFLGVFFFVLFGISLFLFRGALSRLGLSLGVASALETEETHHGAIGMSDTVHYLRRRDYQGQTGALQNLGAQYRNRVVWPFYLGVWSFCLGLFLMSVTFGFVLFE